MPIEIKKGNKDKTGAKLTLSCASKQESVFADVTKQSHWDGANQTSFFTGEKVKIKLNLNEVAEWLLFLKTGVAPKQPWEHNTDGITKVITLERGFGKSNQHLGDMLSVYEYQNDCENIFKIKLGHADRILIAEFFIFSIHRIITAIHQQDKKEYEISSQKTLETQLEHDFPEPDQNEPPVLPHTEEHLSPGAEENYQLIKPEHVKEENNW